MDTQPRRKPRSVTTIGIVLTAWAAAFAIALAPEVAIASAPKAEAGEAKAVTGPTLAVDVTDARHAISPNIYGMNGGDSAFAEEISVPVARWGGNASSRYNFKNHTYNTGSRSVASASTLKSKEHQPNH